MKFRCSYILFDYYVSQHYVIQTYDSNQLKYIRMSWQRIVVLKAPVCVLINADAKEIAVLVYFYIKLSSAK